MVVSVLIVDPCDCLADWELHLTDPAQHHKRGLCCVSVARERPKFKIQGIVSTVRVSILYHCKVGKAQVKPLLSWGPFINRTF